MQVYAMEWRRRCLAFDREQRRPRHFLSCFVAWLVVVFVLIVIACAFNLIDVDGHERAEEPIRFFVFHAIRDHFLSAWFGAALAATIAWWRFVSPGPRRDRATT